MEKIKLGGIKINSTAGSYLTSCCPSQESVLANICRCIASDQANLALLTHIGDSGRGCALTTLGMQGEAAFSYYFLIKAVEGRHGRLRMQSEIDILSIFPHDQNPCITGKLLQLLHEVKAPLRGFGVASSPSAMSVLASSEDTRRIIDGLFDHFDFQTYNSPLQWHAAYQNQEDVLREIICSYEEKIIKTYGVRQMPNVDIYTITFPVYRLAELGAVLMALGSRGVRMPFVVGLPGNDGELSFSMGLTSPETGVIDEIFSTHMPGLDITQKTTGAAFMLHGPHFGDRHGVVNALLQSLTNARISPLALSCTVSSMSVLVHADELEDAVGALHSRFLIPG